MGTEELLVRAWAVPGRSSCSAGDWQCPGIRAGPALSSHGRREQHRLPSGFGGCSLLQTAQPSCPAPPAAPAPRAVPASPVCPLCPLCASVPSVLCVPPVSPLPEHTLQHQPGTHRFHPQTPQFSHTPLKLKPANSDCCPWHS